jgi:RNA polymerase sigma-70 factor, ECF subfamily
MINYQLRKTNSAGFESFSKEEKTQVQAAENRKTFDATIWVDTHGDYLYAFALSRVRDEGLAEDLVQDTLLAAMQTKNSYEARSSERTWLCGILKHKIIDFYRKNSRQVQLTDEDTDLTGVNRFFERDDGWNGHWQIKLRPVALTETPEDVLERTEFWKVLQTCMSGLPMRVADVFTLREVDGLTSEEVCDVMNLSANNFWVIMHRARMQLRRCVEIKWFRRSEK